MTKGYHGRSYEHGLNAKSIRTKSKNMKINIISCPRCGTLNIRKEKNSYICNECESDGIYIEFKKKVG